MSPTAPNTPLATQVLGLVMERERGPDGTRAELCPGGPPLTRTPAKASSGPAPPAHPPPLHLVGRGEPTQWALVPTRAQLGPTGALR